MQFLKLFFFHCSRGAHHYVFGRAVFGEGNHFANVWFVLKHHEYSVDPWGKTAVWWSAEFKGSYHSAEFFVNLFFAVTNKFKGFVHYLRVVVSYCAAR